jgi:L,D-transpeptidase ErfK/SrfK
LAHSYIIDLSSSFRRLCLAVPLTFVLVLHGCALIKTVPPTYPPPQTVSEEKVERNEFSVAKEDDIIGQLVFVRLEKGDTLPDMARHFGLGISEISAANPGVDMWVPEGGELIVLPLSHVLPDSARKGIVINLPAMRLFHYKENGKSSLFVSTYPVGVGTTERPSPTGQMYVQRKMVRPTWYVPASIAEDHRKKGDPLPAKVPPGPENPLGEYALYLSKSTYLMHGTNKPYSIGLNATNGCIRLYPEDVKKLYDSTPINTLVRILNQPYLIGHRDGVMYMEVHAPLEGSGTGELEKTYTRLKNIEKKSGRAVDWKKVEKVVSEARGIPVPISADSAEDENGTLKAVEVKHPNRLYGRPEVPELKMDGWYVLAADMHDKVKAMRLAAIINHQGPPIPTRVLPKKDGYRVISGPFNDVSEARDAAKRLKIDLEIEGILVEPAAKK